MYSVELCLISCEQKHFIEISFKVLSSSSGGSGSGSGSGMAF